MAKGKDDITAWPDQVVAEDTCSLDGLLGHIYTWNFSNSGNDSA